MRVGYFCLQSWWSIHAVHDLELIQADLDDGHEVHVVRPSRALRFSDTDPYEEPKRRLRRELRCFWTCMNLLSAPPTIHPVDALIRTHPWLGEHESRPIPAFDSREALDGFRFHGHDAGNAVLSSLIWQTRDTEVDPARHRDYVVRALDTSIKVYVAARAFLERVRPDRVVLFNGRMATFRGVLRACQETGTPCRVHERGATLERVCLAENTMPHDTAWIARRIVETWHEGPESDEDKRAIGRAFYERKRNRDGFNWIAYTAGQEDGRLPVDPDDGRPVYSIFTSSEFERFALSQYYRYLLHDSQLDGILDVVRILEDHGFPGTLCIRIHPNSAGEHPDLERQLRDRVDRDFVRIVGADSKVDTYALIDASEKVLTFGSTVAMEAAYWGKPSVSFATSPYDQLDSIYQPADRDEAVRLIVDPLEPRDTEDTLRYGYYYSVFGRPLRYSEAVDLSWFRFKGVEVRGLRGARGRWRRARLRERVRGLFSPS